MAELAGGSKALCDSLLRCIRYRLGDISHYLSVDVVTGISVGGFLLKSWMSAPQKSRCYA